MQTVKKPKKINILHGFLRNDLEFVDTQVLHDKIYEQSRFSILYFTLLISSVVICTLGLLTNSTAIVIGGMLIAPLTWPLARLGYGFAHRKSQHLYRGALLVFVSILLGAFCAYVITSVSPIRVINDEILARTAPTLMDLFIALSAGIVAAIAITQKKIADSLAGVAIAVSLMPPLCTVGIALSMHNWSYSLGALILFAVNAACITLVTTIVFIYTQRARKEHVYVNTRALIFNVLLVAVLTIPLITYLRSYSFEIRSYSLVSARMNNFIKNKDSSAVFENIQVEQTDKSTLAVSADLLIPTDIAFTYQDNENLVASIENAVNKKVLLNLKIQGIIEPISKDQRKNENTISNLSKRLSEKLTSIDNSFEINSISVVKEDSGVWKVSADVLTSPDAVPTANTVTDISSQLSEEFNEQVILKLTFVPKLTLKSGEQTIQNEVQKTVEQVTKTHNFNSQISALVLTQKDDQSRLTYTITTDTPELFNSDYINEVKSNLSNQIGGNFTVRIRLVQTTDLEG